MVPRKQLKRQKPEEIEAEAHPGRKGRQPDHGPFKSPDEGVVGLSGRLSMQGHAALLANARSDEHRASLVNRLQQTHGNAYVQRLLSSHAVQAKLTVNPPDDAYEREADRVAEVVQRQQEEDEIQYKPTADLQRQVEPEEEEEELQPKLTTDVQRQEEEEIQYKLAANLQRQVEPEEEEEEEPVQTKIAGTQPQTVSDSLEAQINEARRGGQSLDGPVQASLENKLGHDFSQVRIHNDSRADSLSQQLGAEAFTTGDDVFFRDGAYQPHSESGRGLIAHELTHVVQQQAVQAIQREDGETEEEEGTLNYRVEGVPILTQPSSMTCWATVSTMMVSWRDGVSYAIQDAMALAGQEYVDKFNANEGLGGGEKEAFLSAMGLQGEPPMNYTAEGIQELLESHGPLWVTTDEDESALFAIHARIMTGIQGDGTPDGTMVELIDPADGSQAWETLAHFVERYEEVTETGSLRVQVAHF